RSRTLGFIVLSAGVTALHAGWGRVMRLARLAPRECVPMRARRGTSMRPERDRFVAGTCSRTFVLALATLVGTASAQDEARTPATYKDLPSEIPAKFEPNHYGFDHVRRDAMIPMRDGVKLHTVILVPKGAKGAPILLTRTPYDAKKLTGHAESAHL